MPEDIWGYLEKRKASRSTFGLKELDRVARGIHNHEIMTIGARTSHGKTVLCLQLVLRWLEQKKKIVLFSNEHSVEYVKARMASQYLGKYTAEDILELRISDDDKILYDDFWKYITSMPLKIYATGEGKSIAKVVAAYHKDKPDIILIDHVQMIRDEGNKDKRRQMDEFLNGIKDLVESNPVASVLISQCGRKVAERRFFLPNLVDLKETGSLEELSDIVLLLSWPWKAKSALHVFDKKISDEDFAEDEFFIDVAKNRNGKTECIEVRFNTGNLKFEDIAVSQERKHYEP